jgi:hypothetical protein
MNYALKVMVCPNSKVPPSFPLHTFFLTSRPENTQVTAASPRIEMVLHLFPSLCTFYLSQNSVIYSFLPSFCRNDVKKISCTQNTVRREEGLMFSG